MTRATRSVLFWTMLVSALALAAVPVGSATPRSPVTISNTVTFDDVPDPFTTTGGILCPSGASGTPFAVFVGGQSGFKAQILVGKHFMCADGSGTFDLLLRVTLDFTTGATDGTWSVVSGTGDYDKLHGGGGIDGTPFAGGIQDEYGGSVHID